MISKSAISKGLFICMAMSCCVDAPIPGVSTLGFLTAKMNGKEWNKTYKNAYQVTMAIVGTTGSAIPCDSYHVLVSELYNNAGHLRQKLNLIKIPLKKGRYQILPFQNGICKDSDPVYGMFYSLISDGDVLGDDYSVLDSENNFVEIEEFNQKTNEIKGSFQLTFVLTGQARNNLLPDTLKFTGGQFHTILTDRRRK
jgi:hypothetical protein